MVVVPPVQFSVPGAAFPAGTALSDPDVQGADLDTKPMRLSLTADHGTVQLGSLAGLRVVSDAEGSASVTVEGSLNALNAVLATSAPQADSGFTVSLKLDDLGHIGDGSPLTDTVTLTLQINALPVAEPDHYQIGLGQTLTAASGAKFILESDPLSY